MAMNSDSDDDSYVLVNSNRSAEDVREFPLEDDGSLSLSTLRSNFPKATGLCYRKLFKTRAVRLDHNGFLCPPKNGWGKKVYTVVEPDEGIGPADSRSQDEEYCRSTSPKRQRSSYSSNTSGNNFAKAKNQNSETEPDVSVSVTFRELGNKAYKEAFTRKQSREQISNHLKSAADSYRRATEEAKTENENCLALKNLGLAVWKLALHYRGTDEVHYSVVTAFFVEAFQSLTGALKKGSGIEKERNWIIRLKDNVEDAMEDFFKFLVDDFLWYEDRVKQLHQIIDNCSHELYRGKFYLELGSTYFKWAIVELAEGDECAYQSSLRLLKDCYYPLQEAKRLTGRHCHIFLEKVLMLEKDVFLNTCFSESLQAMHNADIMLEDLLCDEEELNMDGIHIVMDMYREAIVLTQGNGVEYEAMAHSRLGKVYYDVLKLKARAKEHFMHSIQLTSTLTPRNFAGEGWFDQAADALREMQEEEKRLEEEAWRKDREPFLKQLAKELAALDEMKNWCAEKVLKELAGKFPPKHRTKKQREADVREKSEEELKKMSRSEIKKLLQKMILQYHPDHVDKDRFGKKYYVLCEEITKVLTAKYECFK